MSQLEIKHDANPEYPTEEQLLAIKDWQGRDPEAIVKLIREAYNTHYGAIRLQNARDILRGRARRLVLITGGWSGNEDVIHALQQNFVWWILTWRSSERGGKHVFEWKGSWK